MKKKTIIIGVIVCVLGIAALGFSYYIRQQVEQGNLEISSAERKVSQGKSLFSSNPVAKEVGKGIFGSADRQIKEGKETISYYSSVAQVLQVGGIILVIVGLGIVFIGRRAR